MSLEFLWLLSPCDPGCTGAPCPHLELISNRRLRQSSECTDDERVVLLLQTNAEDDEAS